MGTTLKGIKVTTDDPPHIATPDSLESSLGTLNSRMVRRARKPLRKFMTTST